MAGIIIGIVCTIVGILVTRHYYLKDKKETEIKHLSQVKQMEKHHEEQAVLLNNLIDQNKTSHRTIEETYILLSKLTADILEKTGEKFRFEENENSFKKAYWENVPKQDEQKLINNIGEKYYPLTYINNYKNIVTGTSLASQFTNPINKEGLQGFKDVKIGKIIYKFPDFNCPKCNIKMEQQPMHGSASNISAYKCPNCEYYKIIGSYSDNYEEPF